MTNITLRLGMGLCLLASVAVTPAAAQAQVAAAGPTIAAQVEAITAAPKNVDAGTMAGTDALPPAGDPQRQPPAGGQTSGPMTVVPVRNAFVVQPTVRFGKVNHQNATFVGGNVGVLFDDRLFFGGGFQWMVDNAPGFKMSYIGLVTGWKVIGHSAIDVSISSLIGGGTSDSSWTDPYYYRHGGYGYSYYYYGDTIFVVEPQVDVVVRLARNAWITAGASYRAVSGAIAPNQSGVTGVVSITFGTR